MQTVRIIIGWMCSQSEGVDLQTNYVETVKGLTPEKVQAFIATILSAGNQASVVMMPEK